jgi:UDP-glucose 4-epimerase
MTKTVLVSGGAGYIGSHVTVELIAAVIHFAAFKAAGKSVAEPIKYYRNNLVSFLNILEAAKTLGGCNILLSSSATVYGEAERSIEETLASAWAWEKHLAEKQ